MPHSPLFFLFFFFNDTATTEIYTLSLHDALPICGPERSGGMWRTWDASLSVSRYGCRAANYSRGARRTGRSAGDGHAVRLPFKLVPLNTRRGRVFSANDWRNCELPLPHYTKGFVVGNGPVSPKAWVQRVSCLSVIRRERGA